MALLRKHFLENSILAEEKKLKKSKYVSYVIAIGILREIVLRTMKDLEKEKPIVKKAAMIGSKFEKKKKKKAEFPLKSALKRNKDKKSAKTKVL